MNSAKIKYKNRVLSLPYTEISSGYLKLYTVPKSYSDDGYYLATWADGELEPVPACGVEESTLLAEFSVAVEAGNATYTAIYLATGVTYEN